MRSSFLNSFQILFSLTIQSVLTLDIAAGLLAWDLSSTLSRLFWKVPLPLEKQTNKQTNKQTKHKIGPGLMILGQQYHKTLEVTSGVWEDFTRSSKPPEQSSVTWSHFGSFATGSRSGRWFLRRRKEHMHLSFTYKIICICTTNLRRKTCPTLWELWQTEGSWKTEMIMSATMKMKADREQGR